MTKCPRCKKRINKISMTKHEGQRMCPKCKREAIEQNSYLDDLVMPLLLWAYGVTI